MSIIKENNLPIAATLVLQLDENDLDYVLNSFNNWHYYYTEQEQGTTKIQVTIDFPNKVSKNSIEIFQSNLEERVAKKNGEVLRLVYHFKKINR